MEQDQKTLEFIEKIKVKFPDYDYYNLKYIDHISAVAIICKKHGEFKQRPDYLVRNSNSGCKLCYADSVMKNEFITKANLIYNNKFDYSLVTYVNSHTKIKIICPIHGVFEQLPCTHLLNRQCRQCSIEVIKNKNLLTTDEFIEKAKLIHPMGQYDYSMTNYINSHTKLTITCLKHGDFQISPTHFLSGRICNMCLNEDKKMNAEDGFDIKRQCSKTQEDAKQLFLEKAKLIHLDKFIYDKIEYVDQKTPLIIICKEHGEFKQNPYNHLHGNCPNCVSKEQLKKYTEQFIERSKNKHNNKYSYEQCVYTRGCDKVAITCPDHNIFFQVAHQHELGQGCPECAKSKQLMTKDEYVARAMKIYSDKYSYNLTEYNGMENDVIIVCQIHGSFTQNAKKHLKYHGCYECNDYPKIKLTHEEYTERANEVHDNKYLYTSMKYISVQHKIDIICKTHGIFQQIAANHLFKCTGCPTCNKCPSCLLWFTRGALCTYCQPKENNHKYQKTKEYAVVNYLREQFPDHEFIHNKSVGSQCTGTHLFPDIRFDFIFYNLIVEVDEHKHRGADYKCDKKRMYDLIAKLGTPCVFIRYNPDSKKSKLEKLVETMIDYMDHDLEDDPLWNKYGYRAIYLYYD